MSKEIFKIIVYLYYKNSILEILIGHCILEY